MLQRMTIIYEENHLRAGSKDPIFVLPGDDVTAAQHGFKPAGPRQNFIDTTAINLVNVLARKGWNVPDVNVTFYVHDEENPVHSLWKIEGTTPGEKWSIGFSRKSHQREESKLHNLPDEITLPGHQISLHDDGSGSYVRYVGNDWDKDEDHFLRSSKVHSKMNDEPRTYLKYTLNYNGTFIHNNDCGREYDPVDDEPQSIDQFEMLFKTDLFFDRVIEKLSQLPDKSTDAYQTWRSFSEIEKKPACNVPTLFAVGNVGWYEKYLPTSRRLFSLGNKGTEENPIPEIGYESFTYGFSTAPYRSQSGLWGDNPLDPDLSIFKINLKYTNDVYVVDEAPYIALRNYLAGENEEDYFQPEEMAQINSMLIKTLQPLETYQQNYEKPIYLINRPLWPEEAENITADARKKIPSDDAWGYKHVLNPEAFR